MAAGPSLGILLVGAGLLVLVAVVVTVVIVALVGNRRDDAKD
jgi:hypothetical protein